MIARRLRLNDPSKSSMLRLVSYLTNPQGVDARVGEVRITNCDSETPQWAALEMLAVQKQNTRAQGDKTYHLVLSFKEHPDSATLKKIEDYVCKELGFKEHQRVSVMHYDTDNPHLHIAINKIHPRKLTMHEPYYDERKLAKACKFLERVYGLQPDNHEPNAQAVETGATNMERAGDLESLTGWIRRNCLEDLKRATAWAEVHDILTKHGLTLRERGNGLIISSGGVHVKASSVDRGLSKKRLEERLGAFTPGGSSVRQEKSYERKPMGRKYDASGLWDQYNGLRVENDNTRTQAISAARQERDTTLENLRTSSDLRLALIKNIVAGAAFKRFLSRLNRKRLRRKAQKIREAYAQQRSEIFQKHRHVVWSAWLSKEAASGNADALAYLHARKMPRGVSTGSLAGLRGDGTHPTVQKVTRQGTFIYAEGRENQGRIVVAPNAGDDELARNLDLARQRFGSRLFVDGPSEFTARVARLAAERNMPLSFVDKHLDAQRQAHQAGQSNNTSKSVRR